MRVDHLISSIASLVFCYSISGTLNAQLQVQFERESQQAWELYKSQFDDVQIHGEVYGDNFKSAVADGMFYYKQSTGRSEFNSFWICTSSSCLFADLFNKTNIEMERKEKAVDELGYTESSKKLVKKIDSDRFALLHIDGQPVEIIFAHPETKINAASRVEENGHIRALLEFTYQKNGSEALVEAVFDPEKLWTLVRYSVRQNRSTVIVEHRTTSFRGLPVSSIETWTSSATGDDSFGTATMIYENHRVFTQVSKENVHKEIGESQLLIDAAKN